MPSPRREAFTEHPLQSIAGIDTVGGIQAVLASHDMGYFALSGQLCDAMLRDDRINGTTGTRVGALLSSPLEVKPANSKAKAARVAKMLLGDGEDEHGIWDQIVPPSVERGLSHWGNLLGFGIAEILWQTSAGEWLPRLRVWHPQFCYWDISQLRYRLMCREGMIDLPRIDEEPHSDGKWVIWTPFGYRYGWLYALVRSLAGLYMMRGWDYRDWARYNERHGMATIGVQVPEDAEQTVKDRMLAKMANLGAESVIELPQIDGENKYDMKMIEATARSFDSFQLFKKEIDIDIAVDVLGQNLTTEISSNGSRAAAQVQNLVRIDKAIEDARLIDCIREQVLYWWALYNFGDGELAPRPSRQVEPADDELKEATALKMLGDALGSLKTAGAPIDVRIILDRAGVPMISEEAQAAQEAIAAEQRAQIAGGQPGGDGAGGGGQDGNTPPDGKQPNGAKPNGAGAALSASTRMPLPGIAKRYEFQGLPIAVENPAGSIRVWTDAGPNGRVTGSTTMKYDYGFIEGCMGSDGEELDCYVGPDATASHAHVVHQLKAPDFKSHDEDKTMLGFPDPTAAKEAFLAHRNDVGAFGGMSVIPIDEFRRKLERRTGTGKIRATALSDLVLRQGDAGWVVLSAGGDQLAGPFPTKGEAVDRIREEQGGWAVSSLRVVSIQEQVARHRETVTALLALADREAQQVSLRASRPTYGKKRAKLYADKVADAAKQLAARALAPDLAAIKEEIDACSSFDDLRKRVLVRFKEMEPRKLAIIVEKARLMGHLGGRLSAVQEV